MAEDDIYKNKRNWEYVEKNIKKYLDPPAGVRNKGRGSGRKYYIKKKVNLKYFDILAASFRTKDLSYIRRLRLFRTYLIICHVAELDLKDLTRDHIDRIVSYQHTVNKSAKTKKDFIRDLKHIWKTILPERDEKGRVDHTIVSYATRHLSSKIDNSKEKLRNDKFTIDEFERIVASFSDDVRMQAYLTLALESLGRPQELLYLRISDVELHDQYAKITISSHGKEGPGILRCVDSYPYVSKWYDKHPLKKEQNAFFFCNIGSCNKYRQMTPFNINRMIRDKCRTLGINKNITAYSVKRNGVTILRLRGESDLDIQHRARWASTKQLKTYDLSNQEESFKIELIKRGIIKADKSNKHLQPMEKKCLFCGSSNGIAESLCSKCSRPLDREVIEREFEEKELLIKEVEQLKVRTRNSEIVDFIMVKLLAMNPELRKQLRKEFGKITL